MSGFSLRARITLGVMVAALFPVAALGLLLTLNGTAGVLTFTLSCLVFAALVGLVVSGYLVNRVTGPLRVLGDRLERITAGQSADPLPALPDDELGRLAERQEDLAADLARRQRQVARAVDAITGWSPAEGAPALLLRAASDARDGLGLIDARIVVGDPRALEYEERIPGEPQPVSAELRSGREVAGLLVGHAPATMRWEPADQDLLELFAASVTVALRDAELLGRVEAQNERLRALDAEKDDFLRGVSHNLQTPLARIRANADQLASEQAAAGEPDRRLAIIAEQSDRLSRMVRQLLTVSRLDSGMLHPVAEVFALGPRVRRAWEALGAGNVPFELVDEAGGWLAVADPDQVDQVLWALLDNAVKYGRGARVGARLAVGSAADNVRLTIRDHGPGVPDEARARLFKRYERGGREEMDGSGLGLYVSRELCRAMRGDLVLDDAGPGEGAAFSVLLPAEPPTEA